VSGTDLPPLVIFWSALASSGIDQPVSLEITMEIESLSALICRCDS
jgi:hypothetical protein